MFAHPEIKIGEVFFTNATLEEFNLMVWDSKRLGVNAYDGQGRPETPLNWYPVFISKEELKQKRLWVTQLRRIWRYEREKHFPLFRS